jgi:hypothetical protein
LAETCERIGFQGVSSDLHQALQSRCPAAALQRSQRATHHFFRLFKQLCESTERLKKTSIPEEIGRRISIDAGAIAIETEAELALRAADREVTLSNLRQQCGDYTAYEGL